MPGGAPPSINHPAVPGSPYRTWLDPRLAVGDSVGGPLEVGGGVWEKPGEDGKCLPSAKSSFDGMRMSLFLAYLMAFCELHIHRYSLS